MAKSLFPSRTFAFDLPITVDEAVARVSAAVTPDRLLPWPRPKTRFVGSITSRTFEITRVITHRNSFNPWIVGRIEPTSTGCRVEGRLALPPFVRFFLTVWLSLVLFIGCGLLVSPEPQSSPWAPLLPCGMFLFGVGLGQLGFRLDAGDSLAAVEAVLRAPREGG